MPKVLVALLGACALMLCLSFEAAHAQGIEICQPGLTCEITTTVDLQAAIDYAAPNSVILLANGVYEGRNIEIRKNLTIRGDRPRDTIVQAAAQPCLWLDSVPIQEGRTVTATERVFEILGGRVLLENLTIRNGCAVGSAAADVQGGGIWTSGDLRLRRVILERNVARIRASTSVEAAAAIPGYAQGGAVYNTGVLHVDSSTLLYNGALSEPSAALGGGIYNNGTAFVVNSTFGDNRAQEWNGGGIFFVGGGIHSFGTLLDVEYTTFVDNYATTSGGAVAGEGAMNLRNNLFYRNVSVLGTDDCIVVPPGEQSTPGGAAKYANAPPCNVPRPAPITLLEVTTDTVVPVYRPSVELKTQSGSLNAGNCSITTIKVDQLGNPRGLDGKCDLGAVQAAMSFMPYAHAAEAQPDLRVRDVTISPAGEINAGTKVLISVEIENIGKVSPQRRFFVTLFINPAQTPPNRAGVTWTDLCRTRECLYDEGVTWAAPATITEDGGTYTLTTDFDNDRTVVRDSSKFDGFLPEGAVDMWVYVDSFSDDRSPNGLIRELIETNNQYRVPAFTVKSGRILPVAAADQLPPSGVSLPAMEP